MRLNGFIGGTYQGQSPTPAGDRAINYCPEAMHGAGSPESNLILIPTPGLKTFGTLTAPSVSSVYAEPVTGRCFAIAGNVFFEVLSTGASTAYGTVANGPYSFASSNSKQLMIAAAGGALAYIFNLQLNTLTQIAAGGFAGTSQCAMIDDYFLSLIPNSRQFQISSLLDGTTWNGLDFGSASGAADNIVTFSASHRELWLFGSRRVEIYIDTGAATFPFERMSGAFLETGCAAAQTVVRMDNTLIWLGQDERGAGIVWRANGYTPQRLSTHSVEWFINEYARQGGISDAVAYAYQDGGHSFYVLHFPSATSEPSAAGGMTQGVRVGATWVYDAAAGQWHERSYWNASNGQWQAHLGRSHAYAFNRHLVGDYQSGNIYEMSSDYYDDAGAAIRRVRRAPHINEELQTNFYHELTIGMQVGAGNAADPNPQGALRVSNDGGLTWGSERPCSLGKAGNYTDRVRWTALGSARRRGFEFSTSARVPVTLIDAYLRATPGAS